MLRRPPRSTRRSTLFPFAPPFRSGPQCMYSRVIPLLPLWAVRKVQSLSACTRVRAFTYEQSSCTTERSSSYVRDYLKAQHSACTVQNLSLHLIKTSPWRRIRQRKRGATYSYTWHWKGGVWPATSLGCLNPEEKAKDNHK
jgi:hypothetical protein